MSISNRHTVVPFIAGETKAFAGQRLAKVGYKSSKKAPAKFKSVAVSIPVIPEKDILDHAPLIVDHIRTMLENAQDGMIKSLYESRNGNLSEVSDDELSMGAIIAYLESESTGSRLTKELLENWFDSTLKENITILIADKLGYAVQDDEGNDIELTDAQMETIEKHVNGYRGVVSSLSGGKTMLNMKQINGLRTAFNSIPDDEITAKLNKRLDSMEKEHNTVKELAELL